MANLTITFTTTGAQSYRVGYRPTSVQPLTYVVPEPTSSPVVIANVDATQSYAGTVEANCGNGLYSTIVNFNAAATQCTAVTNVTANIS